MARAKREERAEAFRLYCKGLLQKQIAVQLHVTEKALTSWSRADNWKARRSQLRQVPHTIATARSLAAKEQATARRPRRPPPWAVQVLELLTLQQQTLARLEAHLGLPPAP